MKKSLTREEMRELDRKAIEEYQIPGIVLMENAGRNVAEEAVKETDDPQREKIAIVCGKGNNGGDGFVAARHLSNKGIPAEVFIFAKTTDIPKESDAGINLRILLNMKIPVKEYIDLQAVNDALDDLKNATMLIDALFGTGLSGEVREPFTTLIRGINTLKKKIIAVDIPSGLDCDTGNVLGAAIKAGKTVTFAACKKGFYLGEGPNHTGEIVVTDISIPGELLRQMCKS